MKMSEQIKELATALSKAQGEIKGAPKDSENPFFKSFYADLDSCREAMREPFAKNGLSLTQGLTMIGSEPAIDAMLLHSSGQWISYDPIVVPLKEKNNPQALKSGITYMRRAQLLAICAMSEADDDAQAATETKAPIKNYAPRSDGRLMPFGKSKGKPLSEISHEEIISAVGWAKSKGKFQDFVVTAENYLSRNAEPEPPFPDEENIPF